MNIGIQLDHAGLRSSEVVDLAKLAEELDYYSVSVYDHLSSPVNPREPVLEAWSLLTIISMNTKSIKLLPLVTNNLLRHPGVLAKMASSVDLLSKGRLIFGIGAGWFEQEIVDHGMNFPDTTARMKMLDEAVQVILKLWTETSSSFRGEFYKLHNAESLPKPLQKPHPLVLIGGKGEKRLLQIAAKYADLTNFTLQDLPVQQCARLLGVLKEHCDHLGRNYDSIQKTILGTCLVANTEAKLEEEIVGSSRDYGMTSLKFKEFLAQNAIYGTVDKVIGRLKEYERVGVETAFLRFPKSMQEEKMKFFAERLMKSLQS